ATSATFTVSLHDALPILADLVVPFLERAGLPVPADRAWLTRVVETLRERAKTLVELAEFCRFYLFDTITPDPKAAAKHLTPAIRSEEHTSELQSRVDLVC